MYLETSLEVNCADSKFEILTHGVHQTHRTHHTHGTHQTHLTHGAHHTHGTHWTHRLKLRAHKTGATKPPGLMKI